MNQFGLSQLCKGTFDRILWAEVTYPWPLHDSELFPTLPFIKAHGLLGAFIKERRFLQKTMLSETKESNGATSEK